MDLNNPDVPPSTPGSPNAGPAGQEPAVTPSGAPQPPAAAGPQGPAVPPHTAQPNVPSQPIFNPPPYGAGPRQYGGFPPPPPPSRASRTWLWVVIGGGAFFLFVLAVFTLVYMSMRTDRQGQFATFGDKIGVVDVDGVILSASETVKQLKKFGDDSSIKAIIIHVNSPGGGAAASEEIYREVRRIRDEKKKTIVTSVETVGASGAYYIAAGSNKIYANEASAVGSIGVIAEWYNYSDLLKWAKLKNVVIKTGEMKDVGNPAREMTPAEREYLQHLVNNMKDQFVRAVADGRGRKFEEINAIADGRVWSGQQARDLKLIDEIGGFQKCVQDTARSVGISGEPVLVRAEPDKRTLADLLFGDISDIIPTQAKMMDSHVGFYYLWK
ncbi:MAG TPA: signal peptide peptidase SppA [Terriglobales bacterium]|nr:signal peptide peptidase SppA [Terriglobales bacterium]